MKSRRFLCVLGVASILLGSLGVSSANAQRPTFVPAGPGLMYYVPGVSYPHGPLYYAPSAMYVAPLPGYGILPPPLISMKLLQDYYGYIPPQQLSDERPLPPARKRGNLYPAVPEEKTPEAPAKDLRRVRFEITVPYADAIVTFDGVKTMQTGLTRVFVTPAMDQGKEYTVTIDAQWRKQDGTLSAPRPKTFTVTPGDTIQHTFIE